jgi:hypothetical protein
MKLAKYPQFSKRKTKAKESHLTSGTTHSPNPDSRHKAPTNSSDDLSEFPSKGNFKMARGIAYRRQADRQAKRRASWIAHAVWGLHGEWVTPKRIGQLAAVHCRPCVCCGSRGRRKVYGSTMQERRADEDSRTQIAESTFTSHPFSKQVPNGDNHIQIPNASFEPQQRFGNDDELSIRLKCSRE